MELEKKMINILSSIVDDIKDDNEQQVLDSIDNLCKTVFEDHTFDVKNNEESKDGESFAMVMIYFIL